MFFNHKKRLSGICLFGHCSVSQHLFFSSKIILGKRTFKCLKKNRVALILSYFVISNIITLTALTLYLDGKGFIHTAILIYGIINFAFLLYFHFKENMRYNVILSMCTIVLSSVVGGLNY